jgi:hypothetical protein
VSVSLKIVAISLNERQLIRHLHLYLAKVWLRQTEESVLNRCDLEENKTGRKCQRKNVHYSMNILTIKSFFRQQSRLRIRFRMFLWCIFYRF